ncbi:hypothetical protein CALVIDRAFT_564700 [Calocera viscosa TUFC12733]|uniref:Uncharacterized protein n=1 Tax=Calocera viscosa (strain TUFC12733) TaxID=1330018 RepID=A0A167LGF9_CALVF|nr:hypothetical protein CALVIDRAFT_564700 [Calocera viscosa TUFC12733]
MSDNRDVATVPNTPYRSIGSPTAISRGDTCDPLDLFQSLATPGAGSGNTSPTAIPSPTTFPLQYWQDLAKRTAANATNPSMFPTTVADSRPFMASASTPSYIQPQPQSPQLPPDWYMIFADTPQDATDAERLRNAEAGMVCDDPAHTIQQDSFPRHSEHQNSTSAEPNNSQNLGPSDWLDRQWQQSLAQFEQFVQTADATVAQTAHLMSGLM